MLITRASEYALLSLIVLAKADKPLDADTLSKELDISKSFLGANYNNLKSQIKMSTSSFYISCSNSKKIENFGQTG